MSIAEQIYELVKTLPPEQASEVLSFAESLRAKHMNSQHPAQSATSDSWAELVYSLAGTWKEDFPSLEVIRAESGEDTLRESL